MPSLPQLAKQYLPKPVFRWMKSVQAERRKKVLDAAQGDRAKIFGSIYRENMWGSKAASDGGDGFYSGHGSHHANLTDPYVDAVTDLIAGLGQKPDVVDLGCGDFSVGSRIRPACARYVAGDVVPELIERNRAKFANLDVDFRVVDMVTDELPDGDILFIREVLQHLSNDEIAQVIPKLSKFPMVVITELLPAGEFTPNLDKPTGFDVRRVQNSGVVITEPPFSFAAKDAQVICTMIPAEDSVVRATLYLPA